MYANPHPHTFGVVLPLAFNSKGKSRFTLCETLVLDVHGGYIPGLAGRAWLRRTVGA